ncbi:MAG: hypothetical protein WC785_10730 [Tatlockia sp.]|jgi:hypothetical protein
MSAVLHRLQSLIGDSPTKPLKGTTTAWEFSNALAQRDFNTLVRMHSVINMEYSVISTRLVHEVARKRNPSKKLQKGRKKALTENLIAALALSELLAHMYCNYLYVPQEMEHLQKEQDYYRKLLAKRGFTFHAIPQYKVKPAFSYTQKVRGTTVQLNFPRLFAIRIRRILITLLPLLQAYESYCRLITYFDKAAGPFFGYLAWAFFVPRLAVNLFLIVKHLIPLPGFCGEKERQLSVYTRLIGQLQRRWFEVGNDAVWMLSGLLACFVLTGVLAPVAMYFTLGAFLFDVVWAGLRAVIELKRIKTMLDGYEALALTLKGDELDDLKAQQAALKARFAFEQKRMLLAVVSTTAIFLAMCFAIPALAANPVVPFVGAVLVLIVTFATFVASRQLEKQRPNDKVDERFYRKAASIFSGPHVLFKPEAKTPEKIILNANTLVVS